MSRVALKVKNYSSGQLKAMLRKDEKFQQGVRLFACYQVSLGLRPKELEGIYDTSFKSICNWVNRLNNGGVDALVDKPKPGRNKRLSQEQENVLKDVVLNKLPEDYGFNSATWTGPLLISWLKREYGIVYKKAQIYNILKELGLSFQKGKGVYPEAAERDEKLENLKKTPRGKGTKKRNSI